MEQVTRVDKNKIKMTYGFIADATQPMHKNALVQHATMPAWFYFNKPANHAFYSLCTRHKPPDNLCALLELGLKFCPTPRYTYQ
eukprot:1390439-Ditylum_brightwellii.AAC.1